MRKLLFILTIVLISCHEGRKAGENAAHYDIAVAEEAPVVYTNTEEYKYHPENEFRNASENPLSTFSIDVDNASYSNVRRFISQGQLPPPDAVRLEEMINYFSYDYPNPVEDKEPFSIYSEVGPCPWNQEHSLVHIGISGKEIEMKEAPFSNLVFLLDVSGSMVEELPLVKSSIKLLVDNMRSEDKIAIVVYAGAAGLVLPSTSGDEKEKIIEALDGLQAGGSTAGGAGILLAYETAKSNFIENGNNRIILATDGDFNVGVNSEGDLTRLIEDKRKEGVYLTVLGFGQGNYKDAKMELLADKGNGNYYYIDHIMEANKVLVSQLGGTLFTIAKDVKIQVEFNPALVGEYRLIGYENRVMNNEDFKDDKKDAGELGAGHTVTALYEIVPSAKKSGAPNNLRYQTSSLKEEAWKSEELMFVQIRYKNPGEEKSNLITHVIKESKSSLDECSPDFKFAASVAAFGQCLKDSRYKGDYDYKKVIKLAESSTGTDEDGYRSEFVKLVESAASISN